MEVMAIAVPHGAAPLLEVAAPRVALRVQGSPVGKDVKPPVGGMDRRPVLVEPEGAPETLPVGWTAVGSDVAGPRSIQHRRQPRGVELQHFVEPGDVGRFPAGNVMGAVGRYPQVPPTGSHRVTGLRMLQPRHRERSM